MLPLVEEILMGTSLRLQITRGSTQMSVSDLFEFNVSFSIIQKCEKKSPREINVIEMQSKQFLNINQRKQK
jgi:hypothetical protein